MEDKREDIILSIRGMSKSGCEERNRYGSDGRKWCR